MITEAQKPLPSFEPYNLTPLDCVNLPIHVPVAFVFTPASIPAGVESLERGISRLIAQLPFLAGNVVLHPENGGTVEPSGDRYLERNPIVRLQTHSKSICILHEPNFGFDNGLSSNSFLPIPIALKAEQTSPVIRFCINVMTDGIILCISFHHASMDGLGLMNVMKMLSKCCASPDTPRLPVTPVTEASVRARVSKIATNGSFMDMEGYGPHHWSQTCLTSCEFRFPANRVCQLGKLCNAVLNQPLSKKPVKTDKMGSYNELSTGDVFSALLWLCGTRARSRACLQSHSPNPFTTDTTRLSVAVNIRPILEPPLPLSYIGNAIVVASDIHARHELEASRTTTATSIDKDELVVLANLAAQIRQLIQTVDSQYAYQVIKHIRGSQERQDASFYFPDTFVTNIRLLDLRRWNFGPKLGKVANFDQLETRINGLYSILPRYGEDSGDSPWKVRVILEPEVMERLRADGLIQWVANEEISSKL